MQDTPNLPNNIDPPAVYEPMLGSYITVECRSLAMAALKHGGPVTMDFNGITVTANPDSDPVALAAEYQAECKRQSDAYHASPEYAERQRQAEEADRTKKARLSTALEEAPTEPTWRDKAAWDTTLANNQDGYGRACMDYAHLWARLMEGAHVDGKTVADVADDLSRLADVEGITGYQHSAAASMLSQWWAHGDALLAWRRTR